MNKSVVGWVVAGLAVLCVASVAPGGTEADYKALFGEEEQKVVAGADAKAAGAFAVKLLDAAKTVGGQKDLQSLLCEKAYQFGKKDPSGYAAAIEAMKLQMEAVPDKKAQAQDRLLEVTGLQYAKSAGAERVRLGQELVDMLVACGDEQAQAGKASEATALYHKGQDIAASVDPTRVDSIAGKIKRLSSPGGPAGEKPRRDLPGSPDAATQAAIEKAAKFLWSIQQPDGSWHEWSTNGPNGGQLRDYYQTYTDGTTALVAHALMESGVPPTDKRMAKALVWLERIAARNAAGAYLTKGYVPKTYGLGLRCLAWSSAVRQKGDYLRALQRDARQLMLSTSNGSYGYDAKGVPAAGDNSNSIYALVGVAAAAEAGVDVPAAYWRKVKTYWESAQCADGGWVYSSKAAKGNPNMSAAGATALLLCSGNLYRETFAGGSPTREAQNTQAAIGRGLDWLDHKFAGATVTATSYDGAPGSVDIYFLHNAERAALASGTRCFGDSDWYKTGADLLLKAQAPNGTWKSSYDAAVAAAQGMLFLVRGSRPIAFNKLKYGGDWNNRPHALAALTRWMGSTAFTQEPSWRVVSLEAQPADWHDAPILLITGSKAHGFTKEELDKLRAFVEQGGTIFSVTESGGDGFETGMRQAYAKLFPSHELAEAPLTHELYRIGENLAGSDIRFRLVSDGTRVLAVHVAKDLLRNWQANRTQDEKPSFAAALNVYLYLTNKP